MNTNITTIRVKNALRIITNAPRNNKITSIIKVTKNGSLEYISNECRAELIEKKPESKRVFNFFIYKKNLRKELNSKVTIHIGEIIDIEIIKNTVSLYNKKEGITLHICFEKNLNQYEDDLLRCKLFKIITMPPSGVSFPKHEEDYTRRPYFKTMKDFDNYALTCGLKIIH